MLSINTGWRAKLTTSNDIALALAQIDLFKGLVHEQLKKIATKVRLESKKEGSFLILENQIGDEIFIILSGSLEVGIFLPGGQEMEHVTNIGGGHVLGELALVGADRRSASVKVLRDTQYLVAKSSDLLSVFREDPALGFAFMTNLATVLAARLVKTTKSLGNTHYALRLAGGG